ncbi:hypothetical protein F5Y14DRAFT_65599 [Nemania sp. NC0429]|nr:hypothetical protein F5Y14DRAFT_65599 [Nemania sp. NC0429]
MMDPRRRPSDASSNYSGSTGSSVWSTTGSVSFVYADDPEWDWWGYDGVRGAVTRKTDKHDDHRVRFAAHFLRGPFAKQKSKKHGSSRHHDHHHRHRDSDARSDYSSSSSHSSSSRRQFSRGPTPMPHPPPPPPPNGPYPHSHHSHPPPPPPPPQHPVYYDDFAYGPPAGMRPPPPPPPMSGPPPHAGFDAGFIQIRSGGGPPPGPPPPHDPVWGNDAQYEGPLEVWE